MNQFRDPMRLARIAVIAVAIYAGLELLFGAATLYAYVTSPGFVDPDQVRIADIAALASLASLIACMVAVGCWTYRTNANAHAISDEMTISPGWAVGWYFVPIANLFKPFQGMKETWMASHYRGNWHSEPTPPLLFWWWALWIVTTMLANLSFRLSLDMAPGTMLDLVVWLDVATAALNVPLCLILISLMQRLSQAQLTARHDETFS